MFPFPQALIAENLDPFNGSLMMIFNIQANSHFNRQNKIINQANFGVNFQGFYWQPLSFFNIKKEKNFIEINPPVVDIDINNQLQVSRYKYLLTQFKNNDYFIEIKDNELQLKNNINQISIPLTIACQDHCQLSYGWSFTDDFYTIVMISNAQNLLIYRFKIDDFFALETKLFTKINLNELSSVFNKLNLKDYYFLSNPIFINDDKQSNIIISAQMNQNDYGLLKLNLLNLNKNKLIPTKEKISHIFSISRHLNLNADDVFLLDNKNNLYHLSLDQKLDLLSKNDANLDFIHFDMIKKDDENTYIILTFQSKLIVDQYNFITQKLNFLWQKIFQSNIKLSTARFGIIWLLDDQNHLLAFPLNKNQLLINRSVGVLDELNFFENNHDLMLQLPNENLLVSRYVYPFHRQGFRQVDILN